MKIIFSIAFLVFCTIASAQDTLIITTPSDTSGIYLIKLNDNTKLSGKIIERNSNEIIFNDITIGKVTIQLKKIVKMTHLSGDQYCIISTTDGKKFTGLIVSQNEKELTLKTESLGNINIPNNKISDLKLASKEQFVGGKYFFPNPHPTRYFFSPSAIPLEKGEGYYQNIYVLANAFQYGLNDHFSVGGGVVIPYFFFITPKIGYQVGKNMYIGGGVMAATSFIPGLDFGLAIGYATLTLGNKENNFTINGGWGYYKGDNYNSQTGNYETSWEFSKKPMFSFNGSVRLAQRISLISENWVFPYKEYDYNSYNNDYYYKYGSILSLGIRIMGERNSFDLAIAVPAVEGEIFGLPYIGYVFKF